MTSTQSTFLFWSEENFVKGKRKIKIAHKSIKSVQITTKDNQNRRQLKLPEIDQGPS